MREVARLLVEMLSENVVSGYALFGAVAQMRYTEAVATMDADVLIVVHSRSGMDPLRPVYEFCAARGLEPEGEAIRVGQWPVQFIPTFNRLTEEAVQAADRTEIEGIPIRVVRADYLAVIALDAGRPKDLARILALLESGAVTVDQIVDLAARYGLRQKLDRFRSRFLDG